MRYFILLLVLLFCTFSNKLLAQDSTSTNGFRFKSQALQFQVNDIMRISGFQGTLISYKYHFNNNFAFRFGFGISVNNSDTQDNRETSSADTVGYSIFTQDNNLDRNSYDISFTSQLIYYFSPNSEIKFYAGMGPYFAYRLLDTDTKAVRKSDDTDFIETKISKNDYTQAGLSASYGLEWFFNNNMSLSGEYGFLFYHYSREITDVATDQQQTSKRKATDDGWIFNYSSVKLGLSIYF